MSAASEQDTAILQLPALAPPPGVIPNFTNPKNIGPRLVILGAILLTFVIIAIANRAYTKLCIVRKVSLDDFTISLAVLGAIASYGVCVYEIRLGIVGRHQYEVRLGEVLKDGFPLIALTIMFSTGSVAVAASAASVYCRHKFQYSEDQTWNVLNLNLVNLIEIDAGIITACMPSFARMLHHHLPPWKALKSRLKSFALSCVRKGTKQDSVIKPKDSGPANPNKRDHHLEESPQIQDLDFGTDIELASLRSAKQNIGGTAPKTIDDDEVLLEAQVSARRLF